MCLKNLGANPEDVTKVSRASFWESTLPIQLIGIHAVVSRFGRRIAKMGSSLDKYWTMILSSLLA